MYHRRCNTLQHTAIRCNTLPHTATHSFCQPEKTGSNWMSRFWHTATHSHTLQRTLPGSLWKVFSQAASKSVLQCVENNWMSRVCWKQQIVSCNSSVLRTTECQLHLNVAILTGATQWRDLDSFPQHCNILQHLASHCTALHRTATHCTTPLLAACKGRQQHNVAVSTLFRSASIGVMLYPHVPQTLQFTATHCYLQPANAGTLQHTATHSHCNTLLQHTATHCNTLLLAACKRGQQFYVAVSTYFCSATIGVMLYPHILRHAFNSSRVNSTPHEPCHWAYF